MRSLTGLAALLSMTAQNAWAHPGHLAESAVGFSHLVTDPFHLALMALAVGLAFAGRRQLRRAEATRRRD